ncbi:MAG TPA: S-layer protein, partial [Verrucomicrobiales bacterium]|nr:S-layer protein [Verrucomicrobiales bacterium]
MPLKGAQQLKVTAHYTDGSTRDVTKRALYEANEKAMAETTETGRVQLFDLPGDVAVMVRYQGKVSTFRATVPLGAPVDKLPPASNFVDDLVFAKLKTIGMPPSDIADDGTFVRRLTLDLTGRLPTAAEMKDFMASKDANKRAALTDRLLDSPE